MLETALDAQSEEFKANAAAMGVLVGELEDRLKRVHEGGGERAGRQRWRRGRAVHAARRARRRRCRAHVYGIDGRHGAHRRA